MQAKPWSMTPALGERTFVFVFNYQGDPDNFTSDKTTFDSEFQKYLQHASAPSLDALANNGLHVTGSDLTISDDGAGNRTVELSAASTTISTNIINSPPVVFYKGKAIPISDYTVAPSPLQGEITIATTTKYSSTTATDYIVYYCAPLMGICTDISVGGVSLPIESNSFNALGHVDPVYKVIRRGDQESTGSITVLEDQTTLMHAAATAPMNAGGEMLFSAVWGDDWTKGAGFINPNSINVPTNPFGVVVLKWSGKQYSSSQGTIWANLTFIYHCEVTNVPAAQNITNDATDPILRSLEFETRFPDEVGESVIYCPA